MELRLPVYHKIPSSLIDKRIVLTAICRGWESLELDFGIHWLIYFSDVKTVEGGHLVFPGKTIARSSSKTFVDADLSDGDLFSFRGRIKNVGTYADIYSLERITKVVKIPRQ